MLTVLVSVVCTLAAVAMLGATFYAGILFERRRRERFDEFIFQASQDAQARLDASIALAEGSTELRPSLN